MKQKQLFAQQPTPWEEADEQDRLVAEVAINRPVDKLFDYLVPDRLRTSLQPGMRVLVPFGRGDKPTTGYCVGLKRPTRDAAFKSIADVVDASPLLNAAMLDLTRWIAERYLCAWGQVLDAVVPQAVRQSAGTREVLLLQVPVPAPPLPAGVKLPAKQQQVLDTLTAAGRPMRLEELQRVARCGPGPITGLRNKGLIVAEKERTLPTSVADTNIAADRPIVLNAGQQAVLDRVLTAVRDSKHSTFLLHGVTGSGKTEVYIRCIEEVVSYGRQAIVLVPEISLTPQTIRRFSSRFRRVAVLHSHQSNAERHRHWKEIAAGNIEVVVGARSAIFAPTPHLGLVVIDEEHETTFKQETVPRYHAREVAEQRALRENIPVLLGTATPTLEAWHRAHTGRYELLSLPRRVAELPMPPVTIVDTKLDPSLQSPHVSIGRQLRYAMERAIADKGQIILFLNVRGYSPILMCRACGKPVRCPNCEVSLTWHKDDRQARCHSCDYRCDPPTICPECNRPGLRGVGTGTQRLEHEVRQRFPRVPFARMDSDSMQKHGSHDRVLESFRHGEIRILLGTQMISKGLDFPNVTLVGVVDADISLYQPDMRAQERTFQLIAQVAGRTGRSDRGGRVIVQTSAPDEPSIQFASRHDFIGFARQEMAIRRSMNCPPFTSQARVVLRSESEGPAEELGRAMVDMLRSQAAADGLPVEIVGPSDPQVRRLQGWYRTHFRLTAPELSQLQQLWRSCLPRFPKPGDVEYMIDVDPLHMR